MDTQIVTRPDSGTFSPKWEAFHTINCNQLNGFDSIQICDAIYTKVGKVVQCCYHFAFTVCIINIDGYLNAGFTLELPFSDNNKCKVKHITRIEDSTIENYSVSGYKDKIRVHMLYNPKKLINGNCNIPATIMIMYETE